jgi:hypothetical protein
LVELDLALFSRGDKLSDCVIALLSMRRSWVLGLSLLAPAIASWAPPASAAGRFPASSAIMFDPHDAKTAYVRTTFGLLATHDGCDSWGWICDKAIGLSGAEDPAYVVTPTGALVGNAPGGVAVSRDGGCTFSQVTGHVLADLAMRTDGEIVGVSSVAGTGMSGTAYDDHVVASKNDAQSFDVFGGPIDPTLSLQSIRVAPSDRARLYLSAVRGEGDRRTAALLVSYDGGMSWAERKIELDAGELVPLVAAVDPKSADRVYVRTSGDVDAKSRLLVTEDAGKTWRKVFDAKTQLLGFALAEDGSQVFAGAHEGVSYAPTTSFAFTKGSSAEAQCLALAGDRFWVCSTEKTGFFVGASKNGGRSFDAKMRLEDLKGALECPPESTVAKLCSGDWPKQRQELGLPDPNEKVRTHAPAGPALRGRAVRTVAGKSKVRAVAGIVLVVLAGYYALKRMRLRR